MKMTYENKTGYSVREQFAGLTVLAGGLMMSAAWAGSVWVVNNGMGLTISILYVVASAVVVGHAVLKENGI